MISRAAEHSSLRSTLFRISELLPGLLRSTVPFIVTLIIWQLATSQEWLPRYALPSPASVVEKGTKLLLNGTLFVHVRDSLFRMLVGTVVGIGLGLPLGIAIGLNRYVAGFFEPIITFFQSIAGIAWVPLAVIWFGFGLGSIVFVVGNSVFFMVLAGAVLGVEQVPLVLRHAVRTLGGSPWRVVTDVIVPGALPSIVTGTRSGISFGWRALIAAEIIGSKTGLGLMIWNAHLFFKSDEIVLGILLIGLIWIAIDRLVLRPIEMRTVERWGTLRTGSV